MAACACEVLAVAGVRVSGAEAEEKTLAVRRQKQKLREQSAACACEVRVVTSARVRGAEAETEA